MLLLLPLLCLGEVRGSHPPGPGVPHDPLTPPHGHAHGPAPPETLLWGEGEAETLRGLPPEEAKRRLGLLVALMDGDGSGGVSRGELRAWIERRHRGVRAETLGRERALLDRDGNGLVSWGEYRGQAFGEENDEDFGGSPDPPAHRRALARARRRFQGADEDGDGALGGPELDAFLHPEDFQHMQDVVVQETMEDLDRDGDGFIQVDEYIADLFEGPPGGPEPPEVRREREQFLERRDRDGDGRLGPAEVKLWLSPPSPDWAGVEAAHLIHHADRDGDGSLTQEEVLGQWQLFVGSKATDFGHDLHRAHDEL